MKAIHKFAMEQVAAMEAVNKKFQDGTRSRDVTFQDFAEYPFRQWVEVSEGISIFFIEYNEKYYVLKCRMQGDSLDGAAILTDHRHSTHSELFLLIQGYMRDNLDPSIDLTENDTHVYERGTPHEPVGSNELLIIGWR